MSKILIKNNLGESVIANVIRYFELNGKKYMIYSLNEIDDSNYVKLYGIELNSIDNTMVGTSIEDETWPNVISLVKNIVGAAQSNGLININDINPNSLITVLLQTKRPFKIERKMVDLITKKYELPDHTEYKEEEKIQQKQDEISNTEKNIVDINIVQDAAQNYAEKYNIEHQINEELRLENEQLKNKIINIENILRG